MEEVERLVAAARVEWERGVEEIAANVSRMEGAPGGSASIGLLQTVHTSAGWLPGIAGARAQVAAAAKLVARIRSEHEQDRAVQRMRGSARGLEGGSGTAAALRHAESTAASASRMADATRTLYAARALLAALQSADEDGEGRRAGARGGRRDPSAFAAAVRRSEERSRDVRTRIGDRLERVGRGMGLWFGADPLSVSLGGGRGWGSGGGWGDVLGAWDWLLAHRGPLALLESAAWVALEAEGERAAVQCAAGVAAALDLTGSAALGALVVACLYLDEAAATSSASEEEEGVVLRALELATDAAVASSCEEGEVLASLRAAQAWAASRGQWSERAESASPGRCGPLVAGDGLESVPWSEAADVTRLVQGGAGGGSAAGAAGARADGEGDEGGGCSVPWTAEAVAERALLLSASEAVSLAASRFLLASSARLAAAQTDFAPHWKSGVGHPGASPAAVWAAIRLADLDAAVHATRCNLTLHELQTRGASARARARVGAFHTLLHLARADSALADALAAFPLTPDERALLERSSSSAPSSASSPTPKARAGTPPPPAAAAAAPAARLRTPAAAADAQRARAHAPMRRGPPPGEQAVAGWLASPTPLAEPEPSVKADVVLTLASPVAAHFRRGPLVARPASVSLLGDDHHPPTASLFPSSAATSEHAQAAAAAPEPDTLPASPDVVIFRRKPQRAAATSTATAPAPSGPAAVAAVAATAPSRDSRDALSSRDASAVPLSPPAPAAEAPPGLADLPADFARARRLNTTKRSRE
jgi:hypothetical protein